MKIVVENNVFSLHVSFAGVHCDISDASLTCIHKVEKYQKSYTGYPVSSFQLIIDTIKGVTEFYSSMDSVYPSFQIRTSLLFDVDCSLVKLINLFASRRAVIKLDKEGKVVR